MRALSICRTESVELKKSEKLSSLFKRAESSFSDFPSNSFSVQEGALLEGLEFNEGIGSWFGDRGIREKEEEEEDEEEGLKEDWERLFKNWFMAESLGGNWGGTEE